MELSPGLVAVLAFGALLPTAVYTVATGELTGVTAVIGFVNVVLIAVSVMVMFGLGSESDDRASATH